MTTNVFAYGTLQGRNFPKMPGKVKDFDLFACGPAFHNRFPFVVDGLGTVEGTLLMEVDDEDLKSFDYYEGCALTDPEHGHGLYQRRVVTVLTADGPKEAWLYHSKSEKFPHAERIPHGSWSRFIDEREG